MERTDTCVRVEPSTIADEQPDWHPANPLAEPGAWEPLTTLTASTAVDGDHGSRADAGDDRSGGFWCDCFPSLPEPALERVAVYVACPPGRRTPRSG